MYFVCVCVFSKDKVSCILYFLESFVVCEDYRPPVGYIPTMVNPLLDLSYQGSWQDLEGVNRTIVPFLACGDLSAYDSDMTYPLQVM